MLREQSEDKVAVFETMSAPAALATMALPVVLSQIASLLYNITDIWFIGRTNNPSMIGASSLVLILYLLLVAIANLFGAGGGNLMARQLGKGDLEGAKRTSAYSIATCALAGLAFSLVVLATTNPLLRALGANDSTLAFARQYTLFAIVLGGVPITLCCCMPMIMRSAGYSKEAGIGVALYNLANIALDPLLMFCILPDGYQLAAAGIATLLSYLIALGYFVVMFRRLEGSTVLRLPRGLVRLDAASAKSLYSVGAPAAAVMVLFNSLGVVLNRLAVAHGDAALAAVGIVTKVERLPQNIGLALCLGMVPLIAYNFARRDYRRTNRIFSTARLALLVLGLVCMSLFLVLGEPIVHAFIEDAETVRIGTAFLRARSFSIPFMLLNFQIVYYMQGVDKGAYALLLTTIRHLVLSIPAMIVLDALFGLDGLIWSQTAADILSVAITYLIFLRVRGNIEA